MSKFSRWQDLIEMKLSKRVKEYFNLFAGAVFLFGMMAVGTLVMWAFSSLLTRLGLFDVTLFSTFEQGIMFFIGSVFGVIILAVVCAVAGYELSIGKVEDVLSYEDFLEIVDWCEGVEGSDMAWVPNEIPLYSKILRMMKNMRDGREE